MRWLVFIGLVAGCTKHNPAVCCDSPGDCNSIGIMDSQRTCAAGFVCMDHVCDLPADGGTGSDAPPAVGCMQNSDCPVAMPVCDPATHACRPCVLDNECTSNVCDANAGTCVDSSAVLYASPTGPDAASCDASAPCSITQAVAIASTARHTIKLEAGTYASSLIVTGMTIVFHGSGATLQPPGGQDGIQVLDGGNVTLLGLTIDQLSSARIALVCQTSTSGAPTPMVQMDQVTIIAQGVALLGHPCEYSISRTHVHIGTAVYGLEFEGPGTAKMDRTVFDGGAGLVAFDQGAVLDITNSVIENQAGSDGAFLSQAFGSTPGSIIVSFSTVINSTVKCTNGQPICAGFSDAGVCLDNTIFLNTTAGAPTDTITGTACFANYVIAKPQSTALTGANNKLGVDPLLVNPAAGDYHLMPNSPAIDAADPTATATPDLDGTARPQGARADIGAYEYKP